MSSTRRRTARDASAPATAKAVTSPVMSDSTDAKDTDTATRARPSKRKAVVVDNASSDESESMAADDDDSDSEFVTNEMRATEEELLLARMSEDERTAHRTKLDKYVAQLFRATWRQKGSSTIRIC